ncbi:MAG: BadF/BadG/BcrA/BcrD ATPase family protein [Paracoccaceae bacterium]
MTLVFGLDSGGTKTTLALADRLGRVLYMDIGPGLSPTQAPDWESRLAQMIVPLPLPVVAAAVLGLPFHGEVAEHTAAQLVAVDRLFGQRGLVQNDVQTAFEGAFAGQAGVLILAGTGSMAWAGDGVRQLRVGGWGDLIGDEGSAYWIGARAVQYLSQCLDHRRDDPAFADAMLAALGLTVDRLSDWAYGQADRRRETAGLAKAVTAQALSGNRTAQEITDGAADALALHVTTAWRLLDRAGDPVWSFGGGVFQADIMLDKVQNRIGTPPLVPRLPPVGGALLQAARTAGWAVGEDWIDTLASSLTSYAATPSRTYA